MNDNCHKKWISPDDCVFAIVERSTVVSFFLRWNRTRVTRKSSNIIFVRICHFPIKIDYCLTNKIRTSKQYYTRLNKPCHGLLFARSLDRANMYTHALITLYHVSQCPHSMLLLLKINVEYLVYSRYPLYNLVQMITNMWLIPNPWCGSVCFFSRLTGRFWQL